MDKVQDFSKRIVIVVRKDLESWQVLNTVAHISAYFGNQLKDNFGTGNYFLSKDKITHPRNSQYAIVVLSANSEELYPLIQEIRRRNLLSINFIRDMIETTDDIELEKSISLKNDESLDYLGVGVFGDKKILKEITGSFKLWK
ncbi:MAG TPA: DUF2000 domain-containing protein [Candidatus Paceibacterota bacterium]